MLFLAIDPGSVNLGAVIYRDAEVMYYAGYSFEKVSYERLPRRCGTRWRSLPASSLSRRSPLRRPAAGARSSASLPISLSLKWPVRPSSTGARAGASVTGSITRRRGGRDFHG